MNQFHTEFRKFDVDDNFRELQKGLEAIHDLYKDLEQRKHESNPIYLLKVAELLMDACEALHSRFSILRDHQLLYPDLHIERAKRAMFAMEQIAKERLSFRGN